MSNTVLATRLSESVYEIKCACCGQVVTHLSSDEIGFFLDYIRRTSQEVYCFDCDTLSGDIVPPSVYRIIRDMLPDVEFDEVVESFYITNPGNGTNRGVR